MYFGVTHYIQTEAGAHANILSRYTTAERELDRSAVDSPPEPYRATIYLRPVLDAGLRVSLL